MNKDGAVLMWRAQLGGLWWWGDGCYCQSPRCLTYRRSEVRRLTT